MAVTLKILAKMHYFAGLTPAAALDRHNIEKQIDKAEKINNDREKDGKGTDPVV